MEIKYLKKLQKRKGNSIFRREGISLSKIEELETLYNKGGAFPIAFREYLFLGGEMSTLGLDIGNGYKWMQEAAKEGLELYEVSIDRPFFVIHQIDNCAQFAFFYLDEKEDNPKIYNCYVPYEEDGFEFIEPIFQEGFAELIDDFVYKAKVDEKYGGYSKE